MLRSGETMTGRKRRALRAGSALRTAICLALLAASCIAQTQAAPTVAAGRVVEQGKFRLYKFEQAIGEESYTITEDGSSQLLSSNFEFTDRHTPVPLSTRLRFASDLTPQHFEIKGKSSRLTTIDDAVTVNGSTVHIRQNQNQRDEPKPQRFFTIAGYSPIAMQAMFMRYWLAHGSPGHLKIFPSGELKIEHRGIDKVEDNGKRLVLERYSIAGLIWGRETLWLDEQKQLFAAVTVDAEFDHFEAVREGFESTLATLVAEAGRDQMAVLAGLAKKFPGRRSGKLAFVGGTLVDGTGRAPTPDALLVIDGDRILAAGSRTKVSIPKDAVQIDTRGKTILPGLWDMHAHVEQVEWGPIYLATGATTVRDVGNEFEFITAVRDALRKGNGLGPRLLLAGIVDGTGPAAIGLQRVDNAEQAKYWVHRYHDAGFRQMKIYSSVSPESVVAVTAEAHRLGMTVTGHIPIGMTAFDGVNAGMDQINHIQYVADMMRPEGVNSQEKPTREQRMEAIASINVDSPGGKKAVEFLKQHGTVVDPTLALMEEIFTQSPSHPVSSFEPGVSKLAPELAEAYAAPSGPADPLESTMKTVFQRYLQVVGVLHRAGVPVVAGTDGAVPGYSLYREMELYVEAGFTPLEAIQAATIVPAKVMGLDKELGTVEVGKKADIIILGANPLDSISNIRTVEKVVAGGVLYESALLWESVGFKP
jgi:imidazolonepropionase-like amidohydrolase